MADDAGEALLIALRAQAYRVIDVFLRWDKDMSGAIDKKEFRNGLLADVGDGKGPLAAAATPETIDTLFKRLDVDGSGLLEMSELKRVLRVGYDETLKPSLQDGAAGE